LLGLEGEYRTDSLVLAFSQALNEKAAERGAGALSGEERVILAVEALEREVNNGGYSQVFTNSSSQYAAVIVECLRQAACPTRAGITAKALMALGAQDLSVESIVAAMAGDNEERDDELSNCDDEYYNSGEDIASRLFVFIKTNKNVLKL